MPLTLRWGLNSALPADAKAVWGCRAIFDSRPPASFDIVPDRQDCLGASPGLKELLVRLVNDNLPRARRLFAELVACGMLCPEDSDTTILYEDNMIKIVGNPRRSHGYYYMAAWLKE